jgi:hypothetical protein
LIFCEQISMSTKKIIVVLFGLLAFAGMLHAGCARTAYDQSCGLCKFDAQGKMDQSCYQGYQGSGIACVSSQYPVASAAYSAGKCPGIDVCKDTLTSCKAASTSGNDSEDCQAGVVGQCFSDADLCMAKAAADCGDKVPCINAPAAFVLLVGASLFYYYKKD